MLLNLGPRDKCMNGFREHIGEIVNELKLKKYEKIGVISLHKMRRSGVDVELGTLRGKSCERQVGIDIERRLNKKGIDYIRDERLTGGQEIQLLHQTYGSLMNVVQLEFDSYHSKDLSKTFSIAKEVYQVMRNYS